MRFLILDLGTQCFSDGVVNLSELGEGVVPLVEPPTVQVGQSAAKISENQQLISGMLCTLRENSLGTLDWERWTRNLGLGTLDWERWTGVFF